MKKTPFLILIVMLLLLASQVNAQKLIAVQSGDKATFYTSLDTALLYAKNGDDIYLPGGYLKTNGTTINIDKAVNISGVGYNPYYNAGTENTIIENKTIKIMPSVNGGSIAGIYAKNSILQIQDTVSNFSVTRCLFFSINIGSNQGKTPPSNISILETVVANTINRNGIGACPQNVSISNCIIGRLGTNLAIYSNFPWDDLTCKNCILMGSPVNNVILNIQNSLFENCILVDSYNSVFGGNSNVFRNCMFTGSNTISYIGNTNFVTSCIFSLDKNSIFIDPQDFVFTMKNDYRLKADSPGKNAGKDGTDIGIYGGRYPWKDGGLPTNPHIEAQNIGGTTDNSGNLKVNIKVEAQDH